MIVDFELRKGKGVKIEVIELPYQTKINQFTARISNYRMNVTSTKVYLFRVTNGMGNKLCSLSIKRIPKSQETVNFNTAWQWKTIYDTTYTTYKEDSLVRHDTVHYTETVKEVASKELTEEILVDQIEEMHSNAGVILSESPRKCISILLPQNQTSSNRTKRVIGWGYWICVGDNSNSFWSRNKSLMVKGTSTIAGATLSPIGGFIAGEIANLIIPNKDDVSNVIWAIIDNSKDKNAFMNKEQAYCLRHGNGPGAAGKFVEKNTTQGSYYICLYNDNHFRKIKVNVKVAALIETITYKDVDYQRTKIVPKYVTLTKKRMNITSSQVKVPVEDIQ